MSPAARQSTIDDPWVDFWGKYMVWSLRMCCYGSNLYFFSIIRNTLLFTAWNRYVVEFLLASYSIMGFLLCENIFRRVYRPGFIPDTARDLPENRTRDAMVLSERDYQFRLLGELSIGAAVFFVLFNLAVTVVVGDLLNRANSDHLLIGIFGGLVSMLFTFAGIVGMVAEGTSGRRSAVAQSIGFAFLIVPAWYVLHTVLKFVVR